MTVEHHASPSPETIESVVTSALREGAVVTMHATCEVEYDGRSGGYLGPGDRLVVCKPDGTLLVHRPSGHKPVNWMPSGATIKVDVDGEHRTSDDDEHRSSADDAHHSGADDEGGDDAASESGSTLLYARRSNPNEYLRVYLRTVHDLTRFDAADAIDYEERGTEAEMHAYIERNPEAALEDGIRIVEHERETPYGYLDFFARDADGVPVVVEVKRRQATLNHFDQLKRYMDLFRESNPEVRGILVAPSSSDRVKRALRDNDMEFVRLADFDVETREASETTLTDFS